MKLVIAEKPSVARSIAKVLGVRKSKGGYIEDDNGEYIVSWCIGHLIQLSNADSYDEKYSKWKIEDLPILPKNWKYTVVQETKEQFNTLKSLINRSDVDGIICATDAGREGELIFRLVYNEAGCKKPFKRLWISSMEDEAIRRGFENLVDGTVYDNLYESALCRAQSDWIVGINGTRLFTSLYSGKTLNVGRVMTPTLTLLTDRETAIANFKKSEFYTVELDMGGFTATSERIDNKKDAETLRLACLVNTATVLSVDHKEKSERAPKLYDLTTLQREANRIYGYTAMQTLDCIQALYEKKLVTYPRTDSRYLTDDMATELGPLCKAVAEMLPFMDSFSPHVNADQVINNSKVSDHHAILPTMESTKVDINSLMTKEQYILSMISVRLLCAVCPDEYKYANTYVILKCSNSQFKTKARMEISAGWKAIEVNFRNSLKHETEDSENIKSDKLPDFKTGDMLELKDVAIKEGATSPPKRYTEDTLLSAMENAGSEDFAEIDNLERKGLGTPATRAGIIEKLIKSGLVVRDKKLLIPTDRGRELTKILPEQFKSVKLTSDWEAKLKKIECGEYKPNDFIEEIQTMVKDIVQKYAGADVEKNSILSSTDKEVIGRCPRCGSNVYEGPKSFYCEKYLNNFACGFIIWKTSKFFTSKKKEVTKKIVKPLLADGKVKIKNLYSETKNKTYDATVVLDDTGGKYVNFKLEFKD